MCRSGELEICRQGIHRIAARVRKTHHPQCRVSTSFSCTSTSHWHSKNTGSFSLDYRKIRSSQSDIDRRSGCSRRTEVNTNWRRLHAFDSDFFEAHITSCTISSHKPHNPLLNFPHLSSSIWLRFPTRSSEQLKMAFWQRSVFNSWCCALVPALFISDPCRTSFVSCPFHFYNQIWLSVKLQHRRFLWVIRTFAIRQLDLLSPLTWLKVYDYFLTLGDEVWHASYGSAIEFNGAKSLLED